MSFMQATAVITAIDRASGVFGRVATAARAASGRYSSAASAFAAAGHKMHGALGLAAPTGLGLGMFGFDQYEYDKLVHQYRAIAELTPDAFQKVQDAITATSNSMGVNKTELLDAAKGWQELGNSPESFIKNVGIATKVSRIAGITVAEQMKETSAMMRAFGHSLDDAATYKHFEEVYQVASKGMKGGAHAYGEAMQAWAPVAAGLGMTFEQASAFAQTLGGQFDPSAIGNALKTGFMRLVAPVPKSKAALQAQGIDPKDFGEFDDAKLRDSRALIGALKGTGAFSITPQIEKIIAQELATADLSQGIDPLTERLNERLAKAMGGKKMSAQDRKILAAALLNHMSAAMTSLEPKKFFEVFGPLATNVGFMAQVFGKEHAAKFMDLLKQGEHWLSNYDNIMNHSEGSVERRWGIFFEGFFASWDKFQASIDNFMNSVGGAGIKRDLAGLFETLASGFRSLQQTDPTILRTAFWGIAGLAALAPAGFALAGIGQSLKLVAGAADLVATVVVGKDLAKNLGALGTLGKYAGLGALAFSLYEIWQHSEQIKELWRDPLKIDIIWPEAPAWFRDFMHWSGGVKNRNADRNWEADVIGQRDGYWAQQKYRWDRLMDGGEGQVADSHGLHGETARDPLSVMKADLADWASRLDVFGTVSGKMDLNATIKVEGPGTVVDKKTSGGEIKGKLNTGKSMPDAGSGGGH